MEDVFRNMMRKLRIITGFHPEVGRFLELGYLVQGDYF
jgi:hypothetical protein